MPDPTMFLGSSTKFAAGLLAGSVRNALHERSLRSVYSDAAADTIYYYEHNRVTEGSPQWNAVVTLLRPDPCVETFALGGAFTMDDAVPTLARLYTQDSPPLLDVLRYMNERIVARGQETLSGEQRTQTDLIAKMFQMRQALDDSRHRELIDLLINLAPEDKPGSGPHLLPLPSDHDYRADRPELKDLCRRLESESVASIGGLGGVGKSLLAIHYAHQNFAPEQVMYLSLDSGNIRSALVILGRALGIEFSPE